MARSVRSMLAVLAVALACAACGDREQSASSLEVVAAFYPLAEAARQVGGPDVVVHDLTPAGVEPHDLELRPSDIARFRSADLILYLGAGFQPALEDAIETLPNPSVAVDLLEGLPLRTGTADEHAGQESDPHVWLDPTLMKRIVEHVAQRLGEDAPVKRSDFAARARTYIGSLDELDRNFERGLSTCARREIVTSHAAFGYLAARYRLEQIPISGLTPEAEPSPRQLQKVTNLTREHGATTIYFETLVDPRVAETIARAVGAKTAVLNPIEGLTEDQQQAGEDYRSLMEDNLTALSEGLDCRPA